MSCLLNKAIKLLKPGGRLGFICSGKFLKAEYGKKLQQLIREQCTVESMVDLSTSTVFADATTYPAIVVLRKQKSDRPLRYIFVPQTAQIATSLNIDECKAISAAQQSIIKGVWPPPPSAGKPLLSKLSAKAFPLGQVADRVFQGLITSADKVYSLQAQGHLDRDTIKVYSRSSGQQLELETALLKPLLSGKDVKRYVSLWQNQLLLFPYKWLRARPN